MILMKFFNNPPAWVVSSAVEALRSRGLMATTRTRAIPCVGRSTAGKEHPMTLTALAPIDPNAPGSLEGEVGELLEAVDGKTRVDEQTSDAGISFGTLRMDTGRRLVGSVAHRIWSFVEAQTALRKCTESIHGSDFRETLVLKFDGTAIGESDDSHRIWVITMELSGMASLSVIGAKAVEKSMEKKSNNGEKQIITITNNINN
ncbi:hypothetical protein EGW08_014910 [Elysia chlorotica]|uniref:Uncharacterized protein n=1 Tax=Elysia chlorotica TaxID=188477 RepID=A0A433T7A2_ELYCH|nr:hypothetical protein EGW08_014910 [Elysia chlorotica]